MEPIIWLGILAVLLVIEALTAGLTTIWFAGGALIALLAGLAGAEIWLQVILFLAVSFLLLIFTRPAAVRFMNRKTEATNVDALIGRQAVVREAIHNLRETGLVRVDGLDWMARTKDPEQIIEKDAVVRILEINGVKLIVEKW